MPSRTPRPLSSLEVLILAFIGRDLRTPYDLQQRAGLSLGATLPALRRLEQQGYVSRGAEGARGRQDFALSSKGRRAVEGWSYLLDEAPGDVDAIVRTAAIAMLLGNRGQAARYLRAAVERKRHAGEERRGEQNGLFEAAGDSVGGLHRWMRAAIDSARFRAEADALSHIAGRLEAKKGRGAKQRS